MKPAFTKEDIILFSKYLKNSSVYFAKGIAYVSRITNLGARHSPATVAQGGSSNKFFVLTQIRFSK